MQHRPVLLEEVLAYLAIRSDGKYIDATFGRGGHAKEILKKLSLHGCLLAIDKDLAAIQAAHDNGLHKDPRFFIQQGSFNRLYDEAKKRDWIGQVDGILLDLGVSSPQLDDPGRGFSFLRDGPLDMRMDTTQKMNAKQWINAAKEGEIRDVLKKYGEESYASRIANAIVKARAQNPIHTTGELAEIVSQAHPRWEPHKHPATRTFQAIRIFINHELDELNEALEQSLEILAVGGRLLVISFHSLEDRIVKKFIQTHGSTAHWPKGLPLTESQIESSLRLKKITRAIRAGKEELEKNPRARSATLRVMEKIR